MDAVFLFSNNSSKVVATTINLAIITGLVFAQGILTSNPLLANELKLAQNVIAPIFDVKLSEENLYKNLTFEERKKLFDKKITKKYKNGVISDVDVGVKHIRLTKYYKGRSVRLNIVEINKELNPELELTPALASDTLANRRTISNIAKKNNSIVAINGTFFKPQTGVPLGTLMINKKMYTGPIYNRVAMGIFDNSYDMARIQLNASLKSKRTDIKVDNINQPRMLASYVLVYTNDWGKMSPASPKYGMQIAVDSENKILGHSYSAMQIPEGGFVIVGPESKLKDLSEQKRVNLDIATTPEWKNVKHIISGGPYLVKNGEVFVDMTEQKLGCIGGRNPRSAIGYTQDGNMILVVVDGREENSIGMTLMELAGFMKEIGCVNAMNLDGGGSTVMYVNGRVVNNPNTRGGIPISNALTLNKKI